MIQTQRAYEINSKAITTSDQMLQKLSQMWLALFESALLTTWQINRHITWNVPSQDQDSIGD
jgi:hypothetical protein